MLYLVREKMKTASVLIFFLITLSSVAFAAHDEIEDIFNRYGGPPLYRYYHRLPYHGYTYRRPPGPDADTYWGYHYGYYGNRNPDPYAEAWLDREIMRMERHR